MDKPKLNSVWKTVSGRLGLIVGNPMEPAILWLDEVTGEFTVSPILNRLLEPIKTMSVQDFFEFVTSPHEVTTNCSSCRGLGRHVDSFGKMVECGRCDGSGKVIGLHRIKLVNGRKPVTAMKNDVDIPF